MVAVEAQQRLQVQPGQVVPRVPGDHRHHAAAAHGAGQASGRVAAHGAGDIAGDVSDVVLLVVITAPVSNISHVIRATPNTLLLGPGGGHLLESESHVTAAAPPPSPPPTLSRVPDTWRGRGGAGRGDPVPRASKEQMQTVHNLGPQQLPCSMLSILQIESTGEGYAAAAQHM